MNFDLDIWHHAGLSWIQVQRLKSQVRVHGHRMTSIEGLLVQRSVHVYIITASKITWYRCSMSASCVAISRYASCCRQAFCKDVRTTVEQAADKRLLSVVIMLKTVVITPKKLTANRRASVKTQSKAFYTTQRHAGKKCKRKKPYRTFRLGVNDRQRCDWQCTKLSRNT